MAAAAGARARRDGARGGVAALGAIDGSARYLDVVGDERKGPQRGVAMLKLKLKAAQANDSGAAQAVREARDGAAREAQRAERAERHAALKRLAAQDDERARRSAAQLAKRATIERWRWWAARSSSSRCCRSS